MLLSIGNIGSCCFEIHAIIKPVIVNLGVRVSGGQIEMLFERLIFPVGRIRIPDGQKMRGSLIIISMENVIIILP